MALDFSKILVVGVSSRALFNLEKENEIFEKENIEGFRKYQLVHENELLSEGTAFPLIKSLLKLNDIASKQIIEVVVMSRNSPETGVRVLKSIKHFNLPITRWAFSGGEPLSPFIDAFDIDLFLSKDEKEVQKISDTSNCATALIYDPPTGLSTFDVTNL
jgi:5'-nucleotidase